MLGISPQVWAMEWSVYQELYPCITLSSLPGVSSTSSPPSPVSYHGKSATQNGLLNVSTRLVCSRFLRTSYFGRYYVKYFSDNLMRLSTVRICASFYFHATVGAKSYITFFYIVILYKIKINLYVLVMFLIWEIVILLPW